MKNIHIKNGHLIDPLNRVNEKKDIFIAQGKIVSVGQQPTDFVADEVIDADKQIVCPGFIDLYANLREPGFEHKATIATESMVAAKSGITHVCCTPDTNPVVDSPAVVELILQRAEAANMSHVLPIGALTQGLSGELLSEMAGLKKAGCIAVGQGGKPLPNSYTLRRCFEYAASHGLTVFIDPEDPYLANAGIAHEGSVSARLGLPGIASSAESIAVSQAILLAEETSAKVHLTKISTARAVEILTKAKAKNISITAGVTAHHLVLTEIDLLDFNSNFHVKPPLRSQRDQAALINGVIDGVIDVICSDHHPHEPAAKMVPFEASEPGIIGFQTLLPLALRLVHEHQMPIEKLIAALTINAANVIGVNAGSLSVGNNANVCIFDPKEFWVLNRDNLQSTAQNTPFIGWELQGKVVKTIIN